MQKTTVSVLFVACFAWLAAISFALIQKKDPGIWIDENGCQYLVKKDVLTPRLNPNGTQICQK